MIEETKIYANKTRFLELIRSINRSGANLELLERQLCSSDFFDAPASTRYHGAYRGGLCEHSLSVYDNLLELNKSRNLNLDADSMKITALLHDFSKMNFYTTEIKNKKVYSETGSKSDSMGRFDWQSVEGYVVRDLSARFVLADHETTAAFMTNTFIPLTAEEYAAISNHHGGVGESSGVSAVKISEVFSTYPLALYVHIADLIDAYEQERG